jgi:hypothetical protein
MKFCSSNDTWQGFYTPNRKIIIQKITITGALKVLCHNKNVGLKNSNSLLIKRLRFYFNATEKKRKSDDTKSVHNPYIIAYLLTCSEYSAASRRLFIVNTPGFVATS